MALAASLLAASLSASGGRAAFFNMAERDASLAQIVRRQFQRYLVACEDTDMILAHFSGRVRNQFVAVFEVDAEARIRKHVGYKAVHFKEIFFGHSSFRYKRDAATEAATARKLLNSHRVTRLAKEKAECEQTGPDLRSLPLVN